MLRVRSYMKCTNRSSVVHVTQHLPTLRSHAGSPITTVLIGDSQIEEFGTIGNSTRIAHLPATVNLGVSGDRFENVLYRFDSGLLDILTNHDVKLWVLSIGANNLGGKKKKFKRDELISFRILLVAMLHTAVTSTVLVCAMLPRADVGKECLELANASLFREVQELYFIHEGRVKWCEAPSQLDLRKHYRDHLHLTKEGYDIWDDAFYPEILRNLDVHNVGNSTGQGTI